MFAHDFSQCGEIRRATGGSVEDGPHFAEVIGAKDAGCDDGKRLCVGVLLVVEMVDRATAE